MVVGYDNQGIKWIKGLWCILLLSLRLYRLYLLRIYLFKEDGFLCILNNLCLGKMPTFTFPWLFNLLNILKLEENINFYLISCIILILFILNLLVISKLLIKLITPHCTFTNWLLDKGPLFYIYMFPLFIPKKGGRSSVGSEQIKIIFNKFEALKYFRLIITFNFKLLQLLNISILGEEFLLIFKYYYNNNNILGEILRKNNFNNYFNDFNTLNLKEKQEYLKLKFFNKAIEPNIPFLDWFIQLLFKTDGSQVIVDTVIDTNLNSIQKIEREAQLNNHAFFRIRPFLINKIDESPMANPNIIPYKGSSVYED